MDYRIKNLQEELKKRKGMVKAIKAAMDRKDIPDWKLNDLIKQHNVQVRVIKSIRQDIIDRLAKQAEGGIK